MQSEVTLKIGGALYAGWREVEIHRSIEQLAGTFELAVTDKWALTGDAVELRAGLACQVLIAGTCVINGYIDDVEPTVEADAHGVTVRGRDKAGDLVDCAALHANQEWTGRRLDAIARNLAAPFGIGVQVRADVGAAFAYTHIDEGETVYEVLERAARMRGVLVVSDGATGDIVITRAGSGRATTALRLGDNIIGGRATHSQRDRFSIYRVTGQQRETEWLSPEDAATPGAEVRDPAVGRYRPTVIAADGDADIGACRQRASWERSVRAGRGHRGRVRVKGWLADGAPWDINQRVPVDADWLGLSGQYLIAGVDYVKNKDDGTVCEIEVVPPGAFDVLTERETNPAGNAGFGWGLP